MIRKWTASALESFWMKSVFIESVSPRTQVFIEGILIHGPNRLRSGDRVTIAHSIFCLRF